MAYIHQIRSVDFENSFQEPPYRTNPQSKMRIGAVVAVFVNFCSFHCDGCWNQETWDRKDDLYVSDKEVADQIIKSVKALKTSPPLGLSLLGGDPLLPQNIKSTKAIIADVLNEIPDLAIGVWTGYRWANLIALIDKDPDLKYVLNHIDVLIDEPFIKSKLIKNRRYGSSNQHVINVPKSLATNQMVLTESYILENKQ